VLSPKGAMIALNDQRDEENIDAPPIHKNESQ